MPINTLGSPDNLGEIYKHTRYYMSVIVSIINCRFMGKQLSIKPAGR